MAAQNGNGSTSIWNMLHVGIIAFQAIWLALYMILTRDIDGLRHEQDGFAATVNKDYLRKSESSEYRQRVDVEVAKLNSDIGRLRDSLKRTHDTYITKEAYLGRHETLIQDLARLNSRLDEVRRDFGSTYTLNDKLKELQDQLRVLQNQVYNSRKDVTDPSLKKDHSQP